MTLPRTPIRLLSRLRRIRLPGFILVLVGGLMMAIGPASAVNGVPTPEHIIVVIMENKFYQDVWDEPYTASLIASGSLFTQSYAITNPSQPNYIALWSGSTQGVTNDICPAPGSPFHVANLGQACEAQGISWRSYSENLPAPGFSGCLSGDSLYVRKHAPWTDFGNLNHQRERRFSDLAVDIANGTLPRLAFVVPNQCNNTHDCPVATGDAWLAANMPTFLQAAGPNGFVILTWDEDDSYHGNHILTVFAGGLVKSGYVSGQTIDHYSVLRTICDAFGLAPIGMAAARAPITDVWVPTAGADDPANAPLSVQVRPNPSWGSFEITVRGSSADPPEASVFDATGRRVAHLRPDPAGSASRLRWDGLDYDGQSAAAGHYFLHIAAGDRRWVEKLTLIR